MMVIEQPAKTSQTEQLALIEDEMSATQAADMLMAMLDEAVNFYRLQKLQVLIGDECNDCVDQEVKINLLQDRKKTLKSFLDRAKAGGYTLGVSGDIKFTLRK
ncbi:MAG: hypothetical protein AAGB22_05040 [Bacteroidota bacterium]